MFQQNAVHGGTWRVAYKTNSYTEVRSLQGTLKPCLCCVVNSCSRPRLLCTSVCTNVSVFVYVRAQVSALLFFWNEYMPIVAAAGVVGLTLASKL